MDLQDLRLYASVYVRENDLSKEDENYLLDFIKEANEYDIIALLMTGKAQNVSENTGETLKQIFTEFTIDGFLLENVDNKNFIQEISAADAASMEPFKKLAGMIHKLKTGREPKEFLGIKFQRAEDVQAIDNMAKSMLSKYVAARGAISQAIKTGKEFVQQNQKEAALGLAAATVAGIAAVVASKIVKKYLTKAARACKDKKGLEKTTCIQKFKVDAVKDQMKVLDDYKKYCQATKDPKKCEKKIEKKKTALKKKAQKVMVKGVK